MASEELDRFDLAILEVLGKDGRISVTDLAGQVGLSKSPVQARLKRLEREGFITGYRALVDPVRLRREHVAFVQVTLTDTREAALAAFNKAVADVPEIEQCHLIAGNFDYLLKIRTADMTRYRELLATHVSRLPYISNTSTFVAMQAVKDTAWAG
ncbi:Lrp/AsnC ligand binding domain-containing protein [Palleronia caenipelagi]|uniref:Winged helix-turn-helix transcriptional regulator n=1 Tax=Palleronia caenipelagi TaxID=2489174 RepID=A0A547PT83_9RHOB|nr:Lrp/AsnC ligand binding domain-containing protein [Palleronia caenipelagi]TRD17356.1 winged helix-turn-helix transcriptional regulator [Palleronia caenipelagi]